MMIKNSLRLFICGLLIACQNQKQDSAMEIPKDNVLLQEWKGEYGGVPAFDRCSWAS